MLSTTNEPLKKSKRKFKNNLETNENENTVTQNLQTKQKQ